MTKNSSMLKNFQEMLFIFFLNIPFVCNEEDISLHYSNFPKCSNCSSQRRKPAQSQKLKAKGKPQDDETPERVTPLLGNPNHVAAKQNAAAIAADM